ncbi:MAG: hypothetical protein WCC60_15115 [Ilumatobacteraceae bacterium]
MRTKAILVALGTLSTVVGCGGSGESTATTSPLQAIFGGQESPAESRVKQLKAEELAAQCMKDLGWEYIPIDYSAQFDDQAAELDYSDPKFGEKYGYGIVKGYELYELPYLLNDGGNGGGPGGQFVDPNQDYVNALSADEQTRYYADLYGNQEGNSTIDEETGETIYLPPPPEEAGCQGKAQAEVYGDQPFNDQAFSERFSELSQDMENDPRLEDASIEWSDCMYALDEQFDFLDPNEVQNYFSKKMAEAKGQKVLPIDPETHMPIGDYDENQGYSSTENADGTGWAFVGEGKAIDDDTLKALLEEEIALWKADDSCQKKSGMKDLRRRMEQELADTLSQEFPDLIGNS